MSANPSVLSNILFQLDLQIGPRSVFQTEMDAASADSCARSLLYVLRLPLLSFSFVHRFSFSCISGTHSDQLTLHQAHWLDSKPINCDTVFLG